MNASRSTPGPTPAGCRITFNDRHLGPRPTGIGRYLERVLTHWPTERGDRLRGLAATFVPGRAVPAAGSPTSPPSSPTLEDVRPLSLLPLDRLRPPRASPARARRTALLRRGHAMATAAAARALHAWTDVHFEPDHMPMVRRRPMVTTIHDLSVLERPDSHPAERVRTWTRWFERRLDWSNRFICVSHATAAAMRTVAGVDAARLEVVHLGPTWASTPDGWTAEACRRALGLPPTAVVHLGTLQPRKNIRVLLDALVAHADHGGPAELVLLGGLGWGPPAFWRELVDHPAAPRVRWAGYADDAQVLAALIAARGLVCPSHYEGFGLPPLEAMRLGRRAIVSTAPSLVEVTGEAAEALDPDDVDAWAAALDRLMDDDPAAEARGLARSRAFDWTRTARHHAAIMDAVARGS
jgi:alpha-1,3-rhamnosyl/mannosyltransferase